MTMQVFIENRSSLLCWRWAFRTSSFIWVAYSHSLTIASTWWKFVK